MINPNGSLSEQGTGPANAADLIKDSDTARFVEDVIKVSEQVPVIVDFWAPWCGPCKQLGPALEKLVTQAGGLVRLVKINIDENQELAAQLRIQSIPAVFAFKDGRPVDGFVGAQQESQLRAFVGRLTKGTVSPQDHALEAAAAALEAGDAQTAGKVYADILAQDPANPRALAGMIRCVLAAGDLPGARQLIDGLAAELKSNVDVAAAIAAVELAEQSSNSGGAEELRRRLAENENDHQARYDLAVALYAEGDSEAAIAELLDLVRRDRAWNDEAARQQLVKIFDALGPTDALVASARRQLSSILFS
jgi:putative thioredoxin